MLLSKEGLTDILHISAERWRPCLSPFHLFSKHHPCLLALFSCPKLPALFLFSIWIYKVRDICGNYVLHNCQRAIQVLGKITSNWQKKKTRSLRSDFTILRQFSIWQEDIEQSLIFMRAREVKMLNVNYSRGSWMQLQQNLSLVC